MEATYQRYRVRAFTLLWLVYGGYYLCRTYAVTKPALAAEFSFTNTQLGWIDLAYLSLYAIGQFSNGILGDRLGPKVMLGVGMLLSVLMSSMFGLSHGLFYFILFYGLNGYAQSTGWSACVKGMAEWFSTRERGTVMGCWCTCYQVGDFLAKLFATAVLGWLGWRYSFFLPAALLAVIAVVFLLFHRTSPEQVGLPPVEEYHHRTAAGKAAAVATATRERELDMGAIIRRVLTSPTVWIMALAYFCLKFVRYGFISWMPKYLTDVLNLEGTTAGYLSTIPLLAGFLGAIFAGYISDKYMQARRGPIAALMFFGLAAACLAQNYFVSNNLWWNVTMQGQQSATVTLFWWTVTVSKFTVVSSYFIGYGMYWFVLGLCVINFMIYGPDTIMTGAGAMDFGSRRGAATAAGIINGLGSVGAAIQGPLLGWLADTYGWGFFFNLFIVLALLGGALMLTRWHTVPPKI